MAVKRRVHGQAADGRPRGRRLAVGPHRADATRAQIIDAVIEYAGRLRA